MYNTRLLNLAALLLIIVLSVYILVEAKWILMPLTWAFLLSLLILPVIQWLERKSIPRFFSIALVLSLVTILLSFVLYLLSVQVTGLLSDAPLVTGKIERWFTDIQNFVSSILGISPEVFSRQLSDSISDMINAGLHELRNSLFSVFRALTLISIIPLYMFFMLYYRDVFFEGFMKIIKNYQERASFLMHKLNRILQQYLSGMILVTLILFILFYIVLLLLGINYALFFAAFLAVFNLVPYVGVVIASVVVAFYSLVTSDSPFYPFVLLLSLWFIQLVENNFITPYIVGSRVKLNPMVALITILAGASIWGVSGMILFLPVTGVIKMIFDEIEGLKPYGLLLGSSTDSRKEE